MERALNCGVRTMIKIVNGKTVKMTDEEISEWKQKMQEEEIVSKNLPKPPPTPEERIAALEEENKKLKEHSNLLEECIVEMAEIIYKE